MQAPCHLPAVPKFYVVFIIPPADGDFQIAGVFSREEDAEKMRQAYSTRPDLCVGQGHIPLKHLDMPTILTLLVKGRLLSLAPVLEKLLHIVEKDTPGCIPT